MTRSRKKGFYVCPNLNKKVQAMNDAGKRSVIKTWARRSAISPDMVGFTLAVHNGKDFVPIHISEEMIGHKLGEFAPTRKFGGHPTN